MSYQDNDSLKKAVKAWILMINEDIKNNLTSLSLEDNFEADEVKLYYESASKAIQYSQTAAQLELTLQDLKEETAADIKAMAGQILLKVKKEDVVTELNAETSGIYFKSKHFLVDTPNFKVTENSCYVNGTVYASKAEIGGWTFANGVGTGTAISTIKGGEVHADSAVCQNVEADSMNLNPDPEGTFHIVNMKNAELFSQTTEERDEPPNFGEFSSWSAVTFEKNLNINSGYDLHCVSLKAQGTKDYISIYCTEIVTEEETWSDLRLKEHIKEITEEEADMVLKLRPVSYRLRNSHKPGIGLIAQELLPIANELGYEHLVSFQRGYYSIAYKELIPFMIKQIQKNNERIERIKQHGRDHIQRGRHQHDIKGT